MIDERVPQLCAMIQDLLDILPDTVKQEDPSWRYCWLELDGESQDRVQAVRRRAQMLLHRINKELSK